MVRKNRIAMSSKSLGVALFAALIIQYVFPAINLRPFAFLGTVIVLVVALYLFLK